MKIKLSEIHPSPNPVRKTWDDDKLAELAQSIDKHGLVVPIKVRPNSGGYEIIYGHRRVEACRQNNAEEIESIVEGLDDTRALIEALIENLQREDLSEEDEGAAYLLLAQEGKTQRQIAKDISKNPAEVAKKAKYATDPVLKILSTSDMGDKANKALKLRSAFGDDVETRERLAQKVVDEELSEPKLTRVIKLYQDAETQELKEALIDTPVDTPEYHEHASTIAKAKRRAKHKEERKEKKRQQEQTKEVKTYLSATFKYSKAIEIAVKAAKTGRFSPESVGFVKGWHDSIRTQLLELERVMEDHYAKV
jgi:ParB family chromosome partitioning protein